VPALVAGFATSSQLAPVQVADEHQWQFNRERIAKPQ
jgi:hypothetical protein